MIGAYRSRDERTIVAIMLTCAQMGCFALENVSTHHISGAAIPLALLRNLGGLVMVLILMRGSQPPWRTKNTMLHAARCGIMVISIWLTMLIYASPLPVANITALGYMQVPFLAIFGWLILGEGILRRQAIAVLLGFAGAVLIIHPGPGFNINIIYLATIAYAASVALVWALARKINTDDAVLTLMFWVCFVGTIISGIASIGQPFPELSPWLLGVIVCGPLGSLCGLIAVRRAPLATLAPFHYLRLPLTAVLGFLIFSEVPNTASIVGTIIIIIACFLSRDLKLLKKRLENARSSRHEMVVSTATGTNT